MIARAFGILRIVSRLDGSQREVQCYIHKQGCRTTSTLLTLCRKLNSSSAQTHCWNCGSEVQNSSLFCSQCSTLQKPDESKNYFDILCIKQGFEIEDEELTTNYRKLQNVLHPDRFSVKSRVRYSNLKLWYMSGSVMFVVWPLTNPLDTFSITYDFPDALSTYMGLTVWSRALLKGPPVR